MKLTKNYVMPSFFNRSLLLLLLASLVVIASEFKIHPFDNETFRISLGPVAFAFIIIISNLKIISFSFTVASLLIISRTIISVTWLEMNLLEAIISHLPAALFYLLFAFFLNQLQIRSFRESPFRLGVFLAIFESIANTVEALLNSFISHTNSISFIDLSVILFVAIIRSFFVSSIYTSILFVDHRKKMQQLLSLHSNLYTEAIYMKQTMHLIEQTTKDHFSLYQQLQNEGNSLAYEALRLSSELHEVKKNTHRAVASLSDLIDIKENSSYTIHQLLQYIQSTQNQYAHYLKKNITIKKIGTCYYETTNYLSLLAIVNNIVSNAVEAIDNDGFIQIDVKENMNNIEIIISNNGPEIAITDYELLFEAGYTTKFDYNGNASTGIGLHHVYTLINDMNGTINVTSGALTVFTIVLPKKYL